MMMQWQTGEKGKQLPVQCLYKGNKISQPAPLRFTNVTNYIFISQKQFNVGFYYLKYDDLDD